MTLCTLHHATGTPYAQGAFSVMCFALSGQVMQ
jgi:hypothetical protein